jgi:hypothetical protein
MAPGATWREFLSSVRAGECLSWGVEMGFTKVLGNVYELLGKYYRTVVDFKNPAYTPTEKARHFLLALASVPFNVAGAPIAVYSLNYAKQIALSRRLKAQFVRKGLSSRPHPLRRER